MKKNDMTTTEKLLHRALYPVAIGAVIARAGVNALVKLATNRAVKRSARNMERRWSKKFVG